MRVLNSYEEKDKVKVKEKKSSSLIEGNIGKAILLFVLPLIAGSLIQQLYVTVDAIIVGRFAGKVGLAAIDSINTLFKFPINFMNGLAAGATIIISRYFGAKATENLHRSIRTAITIAFVLGVISSFGGVLLAPQLLKLMRVPTDIYGDTLTYCTIYFGGLWSLILYNMAAGILRAFGDSKRPLYVLLVSSCINILGDLLLVGVLHLGVGGAAAATVAAQGRQCDPDVSVSGERRTSSRKSACLASAFWQRAYGDDDPYRISACSAVRAVSNRQFHCTGECQHDGNRQHRSLEYLR